MYMFMFMQVVAKNQKTSPSRGGRRSGRMADTLEYTCFNNNNNNNNMFNCITLK